MGKLSENFKWRCDYSCLCSEQDNVAAVKRINGDGSKNRDSNPGQG